jgi:serralysin
LVPDAAGFTLDGNGHPTGGFVSLFAIFDSSYNLLARMSGYHFSLTSFLSAIGNSSALDNILFNNGSVHYNAVGSSQTDFSNGNMGGDTFIASVGNDIFDGRTNTNGDFMGGDTVDYSHTPAVNGGVTVSLMISTLQPTGGSGSDTLFNIENLRGTVSNDNLTGTGNGVLEGGGGADTLIGQSGGSGDTASYEHAAAVNPLTGLGLTANLASPGSNTGEAQGDTYTSIENLRGSSFNDTLTGNGGIGFNFNGFTGSLLEGGPGGDQIIGNAALLNDVASYEHATAGVTVNLNNPSLNTGDAFGDSYTNINNVMGSRFDDNIVGNIQANILSGGFGGSSQVGDTLTGLGGADTFVFNGSKTIITDFSVGVDKVDLQGAEFFLNTANITALIAATTGNTIHFGDPTNDQTLTFANLTNVSTQLHASDFIVHA